ncbi:helix-turn-helix domain-containing protein [Flavonifractor sp. DFI.6.63]|uniref:helix-turn-helix domain-containing protein n=1 Tax=Flavonifractor sp. DFI.6.63 TaxID=2963704 RepID=UPI00351FF78E
MQLEWNMEQIARRIAFLRNQAGISAGKMSEALHMSKSYISKVERGEILPPFPVFFAICDYLGITPREFFDDETPCPQQLHRLMDALKALDAKQLDALVNLAEQMKR